MKAYTFSMPIFEILRTATEALNRNWGRAVLTGLGMVVGTACLVLVVVAGVSGRNYTLEQIRGIGSNLISVYQEAGDAMLATYALADRLNNGDLSAIRNEVPGVRSAAPLVLSYPTLTLEGTAHVVTLIGTTVEYEQVRNIEVVRGRFLDANDERFRSKVCLVTELLAKNLQRDPFYKGAVSFYGIRFTVIGVFRERVSTFGQAEVTDYAAILPLSVMRYFKPAGTLDQIYVSAESMESVPQVTNEIRQLLPRRHSKRALYKVDNLTEILRAANRISLGLTLVLLVIAGISLLASGIGIMNVMLITVTERTREIGIRKALGALRRVLLVEFLTEAMLLTCGGGFVGILVGVSVPYAVEYFAPEVRIQIPPLALVLGFGMTLVVGLTFGMLPAVRASRMNPVDSLRYE
ncbi:MAG: ABC transporter permease [Acidobacteriota bacterium]|jgi:putative ABC transport system permease protein